MHEADNYPNGIEYTQPIQYNSTVYYTYLNGLLGAKGLTFPGTIQGFDAQNKTSVTYNFSFNVQRDIGMGTVVDVAYVGALSRHLQARVNLNTTPLGTDYLADQPRCDQQERGAPLAVPAPLHRLWRHQLLFQRL